MSNKFISQEEIDALLKGPGEDESEEGKTEEKDGGGKTGVQGNNRANIIENRAEPQWLEEEEFSSGPPEKNYAVKKAVKENKRRSSGNGESNINIIMDLPLEVSVILGSKEINIKSLLEINSGTLIELNKLIDEPVDIYVNGKLLAKGEIIALDENYGVRITDIIKPADRLKEVEIKIN